MNEKGNFKVRYEAVCRQYCVQYPIHRTWVFGKTFKLAFYKVCCVDIKTYELMSHSCIVMVTINSQL